ncbi:unnamed protein product [Lymnaea stagnalis]|uniref:Uncharacterized protein n=1 Tax=Lymnaea stagnalis TaxID=6523 RepID=A0AAV2HNJ7_LYMST
MADSKPSDPDTVAMAHSKPSGPDTVAMADSKTSDPDTVAMADSKTSDPDTVAMAHSKPSGPDTVDMADSKPSDPDTVAMANKVKKSQGPYEIEVTFGGEADLHKHFTSCEKNPRHEGFIPVENFTVEHLPECYRDSNLIFDTIKALASITVLIKGGFISKGRSKEDKEGHPYHLSHCGGTSISSRGTGKLTHIRINKEEDDKECPCRDCKEKSTPLKTWGFLSVFTAKHVIFDDSEAAAATFEMNYELGGETVTKTIEGACLEDSGTDTDWCRVVCPLHDIEFVRLVDKQLIVRYEDMHREVFRRYYKSRDDEKMVVIVSHPHGCKKQISVGRWVEREMTLQAFFQTWTKYTYTASTCCGSSGAPVYIVKPWFSNHSHWGSHDGTNKTNFSGVHFD